MWRTDRRTDQWTDRPTDRRTDKAGCSRVHATKKEEEEDEDKVVVIKTDDIDDSQVLMMISMIPFPMHRDDNDDQDENEAAEIIDLWHCNWRWWRYEIRRKNAAHSHQLLFTI